MDPVTYKDPSTLDQPRNSVTPFPCTVRLRGFNNFNATSGSLPARPDARLDGPPISDVLVRQARAFLESYLRGRD